MLHVLDTILPLLSCTTVFVQRKSTDVASTMTVIQSTTDALHGVHAIRNEHAFDKVYTEVVAFCRLHDIPVPDNSVPSAADPVTRAPIEYVNAPRRLTTSISLLQDLQVMQTLQCRMP